MLQQMMEILCFCIAGYDPHHAVLVSTADEKDEIQNSHTPLQGMK
jgi:hypothetical protein